MFIKIKDVVINTECITCVRRCRPQPNTILVFTMNSSTATSIRFSTYDDASKELDRLTSILIQSHEF